MSVSGSSFRQIIFYSFEAVSTFPGKSRERQKLAAFYFVLTNIEALNNVHGRVRRRCK
jgi:hypothetical protein